ncbi:MAG: hypothetical protein QOH76_3102 [Thermoleophilaceae bacterium]|nr:hypothetical protein [Thermoleophilaceae bacterium]
MRRATVLTLIAAVFAALATPAQARDRFDIRVLARVPAPGYPALSLVSGGRIYVGTFTNVMGSDTGPSKVFAFARDGQLLREYTVAGQTPGASHGVQVAAIDAQGRLYLLDQHPARVVTLDPASGKQTTYGTFKDVPPCLPAAATGDCSATTSDNEPEPDYAAWGTDGSLYVTDYTQGLVWRVPPGGGEAKIWLTDPLLDGAEFGPAGIVLMPDRRTLMISTSAGGVITPGDPTTGKLYTVPIGADGKPGALKKLWESGPREGPDGFALAASGNIYLALVGPGANQIVEIAADGKELARAPADPATNGQMEVPFDSPSSVQFDGTRLIVTNDAFFSGDQSHMVLFDVFAGEPGAPVYVPGVTRKPPKSTKRYSLSVRPRVVARGQRRAFRFRATVNKRPLASGAVLFAGHRARTDARGVALVHARLRRPGRHVARLLPGAGKRRTLAKASVRVKAG